MSSAVLTAVLSMTGMDMDCCSHDAMDKELSESNYQETVLVFLLSPFA